MCLSGKSQPRATDKVKSIILKWSYCLARLSCMRECYIVHDMMSTLMSPMQVLKWKCTIL